jgi:hypothetical protein
LPSARAVATTSAWLRRSRVELPASVAHIVVIHDTPRVHADTFACIDRVIANHQRPARRCAVSRAQATQRDPAIVAATDMRSPRVQSIDMTSFFILLLSRR